MADRDWREDINDLRDFCAGIKGKLGSTEPLKEAEYMYLSFLLDASVKARHEQDFFGSAWKKVPHA